MTRPRIAIGVTPLENRLDVVASIGREADRLGYDGFFLPETWAYDTLVVLTQAAVATTRIRLGTGILGVWNRSAATIAMAASTLHLISGGRFALGLGASTPQLAEGLHDVPFTKPVARMRRMVTQIRALLRGDRVPLAVTTGARPLKLNMPPTPDIPIYLAALGDESVRLTGEVADGWLPFLYPWSRLRDGLATLREGAERGPNPSRTVEIQPTAPVSVAEDAATAREGAAWFVAFYLVNMGTLYRQSLTRQGFGKEVEAVLAANTPKFTGAVPPDADELLEQLIVFGTPAEARRRLARWHGAGADMPTLMMRPGLTPKEIAFTLDTFRPMLE